MARSWPRSARPAWACAGISWSTTFYTLYFLGSRERLWPKLGKLALATVVLLVVSFSWATIVDLTPASQRPYVGSSGDNSEWSLIIGYNGVQRLLGMGGQGGLLSRLFNTNQGGGPGGGPGGAQSDISTWVTNSCKVVQGYNTTTQNVGAPDGTSGIQANGGFQRMGGEMQIALYDCQG